MSEKKLKYLKNQLRKSCFLNYPNSDQNAKIGFVKEAKRPINISMTFRKAAKIYGNTLNNTKSKNNCKLKG